MFTFYLSNIWLNKKLSDFFLYFFNIFRMHFIIPKHLVLGKEILFQLVLCFHVLAVFCFESLIRLHACRLFSPLYFSLKSVYTFARAFCGSNSPSPLLRLCCGPLLWESALILSLDVCFLCCPWFLPRGSVCFASASSRFACSLLLPLRFLYLFSPCLSRPFIF